MSASTDRTDAPAEVELLSAEDARTLTAARAVLVRLDYAATQRGISTPTTADALYLGRLVEAADQAGDGLHNVLSTLSSFLDDPRAARELKRFDYSAARRAGTFRP